MIPDRVFTKAGDDRTLFFTKVLEPGMHLLKHLLLNLGARIVEVGVVSEDHEISSKSKPTRNVTHKH
jgi:hypothetical protein